MLISFKIFVKTVHRFSLFRPFVYAIVRLSNYYINAILVNDDNRCQTSNLLSYLEVERKTN